jgi:isoleucyl-tRNA synthetase
LALIDYYILSQLEKLIHENQKKYQEYNFNSVYTNLLKFCINDLSSFYFEISKDSLYCDSLDSSRRKQITTTLYYLLWGLLKIVSPILPFLTEEIYQNLPFKFGFANQESIQLVHYPPKLITSPSTKKELLLITDLFFPLRQEIYQFLEKARQEKITDFNSQACLTIYFKDPPP